METIEINYKGVNLIVTGYYTAEVDEVLYDVDLCGHPGDSAEFELEDIFVQETDIFSMLSQEQTDEIIQLVILKIQDNE